MCNYVALLYLEVKHGCSCAILELLGTFIMEENFTRWASLTDRLDVRHSDRDALPRHSYLSC